MNVPSLLTETVRRGIALEAHGDTLRYDAPAGTMTPELKDRLREHKAELLRLLSGAEGITSPAYRDGEERRNLQSSSRQ